MEQSIRRLYPHFSNERFQEVLDFANERLEEWDGSNATEQPGCSTWSIEDRMANQSLHETERFIRVVWEAIFKKFGSPEGFKSNQLHSWYVLRKKLD
ncbi:unnamed protein product [Caenorhabditis angaria]|uniref:Uncharacterized protein n=1 Tax=Caenorhabditis angaria TaxID=860376 RepID=A0A9P1J5Q4_9PELO|nr:unnamed protein product [Caenorhabditis angaria]